MKKNQATAAAASTALRIAAAAFEQGRVDEAVAQFLELTRRHPGLLGAHVGLAVSLQRLGRNGEAMAALGSAAERFPKEPDVHFRLGNLQAGAQQWAEAERSYGAACRLQPGHAVAQHNRGVALQERGRLAEAIAAFERAVAARPDYANAFCSLGLAHQANQAPEAALAAFARAVRLDGRDSRFALEHARMRVNMGQFAPALAELEALAARRPDDAAVFNLMGIALKNLRRPDEALVAFDRAIALDPRLTEALNNRANLRLLARRFNQALEDYDAALALKPGLDWLRGTRLYAASHAFEWTGYETQLAAVVQGVRQQARAIQPLALQTLVDDPALQQQAAALWTLSACAPAREATAAAHASAPGRIRIAYVAKDFRAHPVAFLIAELIELHDRERFEVIAINYGAASSDPMQARLRKAFDRFLDVEQLSDPAVAELARSLGVDIAGDLSGFTDGARSSIFACRAAPVQVSYLGYLGTSGTRLYDYLLADAHLVPAEHRDCYDENIVLLPSYQANDRRRPQPAPASRAAAGLPETGVVYCCFNNPCKITPAVFAGWMRILAAVPGSVLWLLQEDDSAPANLRRHAQGRGIDGGRIVFARRADRETYLAQLGTADLFLDTLPYNAGTTASDALWVGLPVLTQRGRSFAARMAASLLAAMDLPELITDDAPAYEALAVRLGQEPQTLAALKARVAAQRAATRLFDTPRFTRSLEQAYGQMHAAAAAGQPPRDIVVPD